MVIPSRAIKIDFLFGLQCWYREPGILVGDALPFLHEWVLFWWAYFFCSSEQKFRCLGISYPELIEHFSFLGPNIWLEYGQYSVGGIGQKGGLEKVRSVFERALSSVGLHMTKGLAIWEAYREFESAIVEAARVSDQCLPWPPRAVLVSGLGEA